MDVLIKVFEELEFVVVATPSTHHISFKIYHVEGWQETNEGSDVWNRPLFHKADSPTSPDPVDKMEDAEVYLHGDVKWDGCSNWIFDEQERCMLHGCRRKDVQRFGDILSACWDWAKELLPNFCGD